VSNKPTTRSRASVVPEKRLIVTHQGPDLDACASVWLLQRFAPDVYANAQIAFVPAGNTLSEKEISKLGFTPDQVIHVDTGKGEFDHHQPERAIQYLSAAMLVYTDLCDHYPHLQADGALRVLVDHVTDVDHFGEVNWPDAGHPRYCMMLHDLLNGLENIYPHNDEMLLRFCLQALDGAHAQLKQALKAGEIIAESGVQFEIKEGKALALETANDETLSLAQKQGYVLVIKKDPKQGHVRVKARPDSNIMLEELYQKILTLDQTGTWFYHQGGKMLLNNSRKNPNHRATPLSLDTLVGVIKEIYG